MLVCCVRTASRKRYSPFCRRRSGYSRYRARRMSHACLKMCSRSGARWLRRKISTPCCRSFSPMHAVLPARTVLPSTRAIATVSCIFVCGRMLPHPPRPAPRRPWLASTALPGMSPAAARTCCWMMPTRFRNPRLISSTRPRIAPLVITPSRCSPCRSPIRVTKWSACCNSSTARTVQTYCCAHLRMSPPMCGHSTSAAANWRKHLPDRLVWRLRTACCTPISNVYLKASSRHRCRQSSRAIQPPLVIHSG